MWFVDTVSHVTIDSFIALCFLPLLPNLTIMATSAVGWLSSEFTAWARLLCVVSEVMQQLKPDSEPLWL